MARTATKKKTKKKKTSKKKTTKKKTSKTPARKKASGKGKKPKAKPAAEVDLNDLESEIEADLAREFDFDEGDVPEKEETGSLIGKTVQFEGEKGESLTGVVRKLDGETLVIENETAFWRAEPSDVTVVDDGGDEIPTTKPAPKKPAKEPEPKSKGSKKPEPKGKGKAPEPTNSERMREIPVDSIQVIIKALPRDVDEESDKHKRILSDMKRRKQREPIKVDSFDKPVLVDGLCRLTIAKKLGWKTIRAVEDGSEDAQDRLYNGIMDNEMRRAMHWIDLTRAILKLVKGGKYKQRSVCNALGMRETKLSRMIAALNLLDKDSDLTGLARKESASMTVFTELPGAPKQVIKEVKTALESGKTVTRAEVQARRREVEKGESSKGKGKKPKGSPPAPPPALTHQDLPRTDLGDTVRIRIHDDRIELTRVEIPWKKKTFRNFNLMKQIKGAFDEAFADEGTAIGSWKALEKALTSAKAELLS